MSLDKITEVITHFIGVFHLAIEGNRLRDDYEKFKAQQASAAEHERMKPTDVAVNAKYRLEGYTPNGALDPSDQAKVFSLGAAKTVYPLAQQNAPGSAYGSNAPPEQSQGPVQSGTSGGTSTVQLTLEPAGSSAVIVSQTTFLQDNDFIQFGTSAQFLDPEVFDAALQRLINLAQTADIMGDLGKPQTGKDAQAFAQTVHATMTAAPAAAIAGFTVHVAHGANAQGLYLDGTAVDAFSDIDDLLPAYLQPDDVENDPQESDPMDGAGPEDDGPAVDIVDVDPGHAVVTGGNMLVNEANVAAAWLDAPVISVMGDVFDLNVISQINVAMEHDAIPGTAPSAAPEVLNMAKMKAVASAPQSEGAGPDPAQEADLPEHYVVRRLETDVTLLNWVHQYSFATDHDRAEISFSGAETRIGTGDNVIMNGANLFELGHGYDLIMISGSMISVNMITQMNVLLDSDHVTFGGGALKGALGGDNLLANSAAITSVGIDKHTPMTAPFTQATKGLAGGGDHLSKATYKQDLFDGIDLLRVLYIDGDFITMNVVQQSNILGDLDQVHLALERFQEKNGGDVDLTTGSNALLNIASLATYGTDSTVMVGGEVYSDALLYQAKFINTGADPLGVQTPALATEAVAFLADDMIAPEPTNHGPGVPLIDAGQPSPDVMQTMLA